MNIGERDALVFAKCLVEARIAESKLKIGNLELTAINGITNALQYNRTPGLDMLANTHEYTIKIGEEPLQLSMQLYENISNHYRLFCYTWHAGISGMVFSINLTTNKEDTGAITLTQKIKFSEQQKSMNTEKAQQFRAKKQSMCSQYLLDLGYEVSANHDINLGIFNTNTGKFAGTNPNKFLKDFLSVSIVKGHFMGNKGYILPNVPAF